MSDNNFVCGLCNEDIDDDGEIEEFGYYFCPKCWEKLFDKFERILRR